MKQRNLFQQTISVLFLLLAAAAPGLAQKKGLAAIQAKDMVLPLRFLSAQELQGRNTPSCGLNIAARYLALNAERAGLRPLLPGGSFFQELAVEVSSVSANRSWLRLTAEGKEQRYFCPRDFGLTRIPAAGRVEGKLIFLGLGLAAAHLQWNDIGPADLKDKIAVILDATLPKDHILKPEQNRAILMSRTLELRRRGAAAVIKVISREREAEMARRGLDFDLELRTNFPDLKIEQPAGMPASPFGQASESPTLFPEIEVRRAAAASLLGIAPEELEGWTDDLLQGRQVPQREFPGRTLEISLALDKRPEKTWNVVGVREGRDPALKNEYIVLTAHYDHVGAREGVVRPGSDDNASGSVALLEIAEALSLEQPRRSVVFAWLTAEEKGLLGSYGLLARGSLPADRISADINLDMISRNAADFVYLIGSDVLSSELDQSVKAMNERFIHLKLDYSLASPSHPQRFFMRSDHYPFIRYGIPSLCLSGGIHPDYHQEGDTSDKADFRKMENVARLAYLIAWDLANRPALLKLDINPEVTQRGAQNLKHNWLQPPPKPALPKK